MARRIILVGLMALFATLSGGAAAAQEASPTPGGNVPAPEECVIEPRAAESLLSLAAPIAATPELDNTGTPAAAAGPPVLAVPFEAPDGEPVDAETATAVSAVIRQEWACGNAMDTARQLNLYTDEFLRQAWPPEFLAAVAAGNSITVMGEIVPGPPVALPPAEQAALFAVLDIERLADDRVGAYVVVDTYLDPIPVEVNYMILRETDAGWKVDGYICFSAEGQHC